MRDEPPCVFLSLNFKQATSNKPPTRATRKGTKKMNMRKLTGNVAILAAAICAAAMALPSYADTNITEYVKLTEDADWSALGTQP